MNTHSQAINQEVNQLQEKTLKDKIAQEKRKRNQAYFALNHFLSFSSYFDFFSHDTFQIAKHAKYLAQSIQLKEVPSEFLLIPFLEINSEISIILQEYGFTCAKFRCLTQKYIRAKGFASEEKRWFAFRLPFFRKKARLKKSICFSFEVNLIFEKAAENALARFKTPVITPEILFITIMEEKSYTAGGYIASLVSNQMEWYLLRYKLIKRIYSHELNIRSQLKKNEQYFAYLLKTQLPEIEFDRLIENELLPLGILFFRNNLIHRVISTNLIECLENETYKSIKATSTRKYSL